MNETTQARALAGRVAKWLVDKGQPDEAVMVLSAWAASGPNDSEGQGLLAEALRIDPSAHLAQLAFERMEGVAGDHGELDAAVVRWSLEELTRIESEIRRPTFRRAQMGYNNNIRYREQVFHVQTEDSGLDAPHIITQLFADGGRVIKAHKRNYDEHVRRADIAEFVRELMKAQHLEMCKWLREGRFDRVIEGLEIGGVQVLTTAPDVDVRKLPKKGNNRSVPPAAQAPTTQPPTTQPPTTQPPSAAQAPTAAQPASAHLPVAPLAAAQPAVAVLPAAIPSLRPAPPKAAAPDAPPVRFRLHVLRSLWGGPEKFELAGERSSIGREATIALTGETFCHAREGLLVWRGKKLVLEDLEGGNGIFLRIRTPVELELGDQFVVGDQLLSVERNPVPNDGPDPDPTYFYSSPKWPSSFRVVQIFEGGAWGACVVARGNTLQVGSAIGDLVFPDDPLVSEQHCVIEEQAGVVVLTDLASRTGVFVRVRGEQELAQGDELMIGRTRLVVDFP